MFLIWYLESLGRNWWRISYKKKTHRRR